MPDGKQYRSHSLRVILAFALFCLVFALCVPLCTNSLSLSDAADYLRAARFGFWSQYADSSSVGLTGFLALYQSRPNLRAHLWHYLYRQNDVAALRHFHVPARLLPSLYDSSCGQSRAQRIFGVLLESDRSSLHMPGSYG